LNVQNAGETNSPISPTTGTERSSPKKTIAESDAAWIVPDGSIPAAVTGVHSSTHYVPLCLEEENTHGSIVPATRQIFTMCEPSDLQRLKNIKGDVNIYNACNKLPRALVIYDAGEEPRMSMLDREYRRRFINDPYTDQHYPVYEFQGTEQGRPTTPRLQAAFSAESKIRLPPPGENDGRYGVVRAKHLDILDDKRITYVTSAQNLRLDPVMRVNMETISVIEVPPGGNLKLCDFWVNSCMSCLGRAPSIKKPGYILLAATHYWGKYQSDKAMSPRECMAMMVAALVHKGADPDWHPKRTKMELMLIGGMRVNESSGGCQLDEETAFLDMKEEFPIVSARTPTAPADVNSMSDAIHRDTHDDHNMGVNIVLGVDNVWYSHGRLWEESQNGEAHIVSEELLIELSKSI
jgi:hypothetical protein